MTLIDGTSLDEPYADGNFAEGIAYLFIVRDAFSDDIVSWLVMGVFALLAVAFALPFALHRAKKMSDELHRELVTRTVSWSWLVAIIGGAILLGRGATIAAVALLSLLAYRDFARATGVFRFRSLSVVFTLGTCALAFAAADRWHRMYFATTSLVVLTLAVITIARDELCGGRSRSRRSRSRGIRSSAGTRQGGRAWARIRPGNLQTKRKRACTESKDGDRGLVDICHLRRARGIRGAIHRP